MPLAFFVPQASRDYRTYGIRHFETVAFARRLATIFMRDMP
jgi:hypothetical protein